MPQDHASWDRKELPRLRKRDRPSEPPPPFDSPPSPSSHRDFSRWGSASDFRRPNCNGKQGGRYDFEEETSHGYTSSRSSARMFENDYHRPLAPRGDWRYARNFRDDRVPFSHKDWKGDTWEMNNGSSRDFERPFGVRNGRRSVDERPPHASDTHTTLVNTWDPPPNFTHQPEMCTPVRTLKFANEQNNSDQRPSSLPIDPRPDRPSSENSYDNKECSTENQCNGLMYARRLAYDNSLEPPIRNTELEGTRKPHLKDMQDNRLRGVGDLDGAMKSGKESSLGAVGKLPVWPQDHTSWDRKELLRPRKRERPSEPPFDSPSSHHVPREYSRWGSGDFRRPNCHGKQGGRYQFAEETSHDYYRQSAPRGDWRYTRNCRDDRVPLSQKEKCNTLDMSNSSSRAFERPCGVRNGRRSVDERPLHASDAHTTLVNSWDSPNSTHQPDIEMCTPVQTLKFKNELKFSDQRPSLPIDPHSDCLSLSERPSSENSYENKECSTANQSNGLMYARRLANDNSLDPPIRHAELEGTRKQLHLENMEDNRLRGGLRGVSDLDGTMKSGKESSLGATGKPPVCSGSFSSQSSGFSHSSSFKSLGAGDSSDRKQKVIPKIVAATQSSSGDATACATTTLSEEMIARKKRLGWGEGLAKYENKKVDVNTTEDGTALLENGTGELRSLNKNITDESPTAAIAPDYGSPTTPSSVDCSSSPGFADKSSAKAAIGASDVSNMCRSPSPVSSNYLERLPINIDELDDVSMERFGCLLSELLGTDDPVIGDFCSAQLTSMNRLLAWKGDILKAVEMAESEIDLLENKQKALKIEGRRQCRAVEPSSYVCQGDENVFKKQENPCILGPKIVASSVAETLVRDPVHQAVSAKAPVEIFGDSTGEVKSLTQAFATAGSNEDILPIPSVRAVASSKAINTSAVSSQEAIDLFSADDMVSNEDLHCAKLLSTNKIYASESSGVFNELLPREFSSFDDSRFLGVRQRQFDSHVKEKIADRIELLRAREKILLLRFKAFQFAWKKDLHQLALTKHQPKSNKRTEVLPNAKISGRLKLPQPLRLRLSSSAQRRDSVASTTELVSYMKKLQNGTHLTPFRDILRMPAMILDEKERARSRFISSNGMIEDPCDVEKERTKINPWTPEEKETFLDMLAMHGKDFKKIASYLSQKTTADCVEYYYKNHKSDSFGKIKKQRGYGKEGKHTYMLAPRKKWNREMGAASLDILGAVSIIASNAGKVASTRQISSKRITLRGSSSSSSLQHDGKYSEGCSHSFGFPRKRNLGADVVAVGPLSSEQINSREECMYHLKIDPAAKKPRISHSTHNENSNEDDDSCSEESCEETGPIHWTDAERSAFIQGFSLFGKNFASLSSFVRTRSPDQCRVFFSKVRKCLGLECRQSGSANVSTSASVDNANEGVGGSDLEDPCAMESIAAICNDGVSAKIGLNSPTSPFNMNQDGANHSGSANVEAGLSRSEQDIGLTLLCLKDGTSLVNNACSNGDFPGVVSGTFGKVYQGFNSEEGRICAIKEVKVISDDKNSKECLKQLNQEINVLSQLCHPNIVQYYGSELSEETLSVYLEFVSGGSIHKLLTEYGAFTEPVIQNYTRQILSGLAYLHGRNTVHRDIKGANILVDPNGEIKLADFGMAKHVTAYSTMLSFTGSPYWMAPEVVMHKNGYTLAVDVWSVGCTILEMATAKPPWSQFEGVAAIFKIGNSKDMPEIPDHLSNDAKNFIRLCLQRNPTVRPTAAQLLEHPFLRVHSPRVASTSMHKDVPPRPYDGSSSMPTREPPFSGRHPVFHPIKSPSRENVRAITSLPVSPCSSPLRQLGPAYKSCFLSPPHPSYAFPVQESGYNHQAEFAASPFRFKKDTSLIEPSSYRAQAPSSPFRSRLV